VRPSKEDGVEQTYYDHGTAAERWERARMFFDARDYAGAARVLGGLVEEVPEQSGPRLLLARAYYHSARLAPAEAALRDLLERAPGDAYAYLLLGRVLQRQGRHDEASGPLRMAAMMNPDLAVG
jgi:hypothetical protein